MNRDTAVGAILRFCSRYRFHIQAVSKLAKEILYK